MLVYAFYGINHVMHKTLTFIWFELSVTPSTYTYTPDARPSIIFRKYSAIIHRQFPWNLHDLHTLKLTHPISK